MKRIDIRKFDKSDVLFHLYHRAKNPENYPTENLEIEDFRHFTATGKPLVFRNLCGKNLNVDLSEQLLQIEEYEQINGNGSALEALKELNPDIKYMG